MIEILYRVWNKIKKEYQRTSNSGNRFYQNETGAKLGVRRMKEFWRLQGDEFEIQEWIALPKEEYEKLLNVQDTLCGPVLSGNTDNGEIK